MKKKLIIVAVALLVVAYVASFIGSMMDKKQASEEVALTKQLAPALIELLRDRQAKNFPYAPGQIEWDGKYLVISRSTAEVDMDLGFRYNKTLNEELGTDRFLPGGDINGIVWIDQDSAIVGEYDNGWDASRKCFILYFLDLKQKAVLAQDIIWGSPPPQRITYSRLAGGRLPKESEVTEVIRGRMKN